MHVAINLVNAQESRMLVSAGKTGLLMAICVAFILKTLDALKGPAQFLCDQDVWCVTMFIEPGQTLEWHTRDIFSSLLITVQQPCAS